MSELSTTNTQPARTVEAVTLEIQTLQRQAQQLLLGYAIEIGRRLVEDYARTAPAQTEG